MNRAADMEPDQECVHVLFARITEQDEKGDKQNILLFISVPGPLTALTFSPYISICYDVRCALVQLIWAFCGQTQMN